MVPFPCRGHEKESLSLMQSYLPKDTAGTSSGYAEGGGLYALGLIHANHGGDITEYLLGKLHLHLKSCHFYASGKNRRPVNTITSTFFL
jgi:hypothetical protein